MDQITAIRAIIRKKENDYFNGIIAALRDDDFQSFSKSTNNLNELRILEVKLSEICVRIHSAEKEVEDIGKQVDSL